MATMLARTVVRVSQTNKGRFASVAARAFTSTAAVSGNVPVDFEHFSSGWDVDSSAVGDIGKYHIETFNKISPQNDHFLTPLEVAVRQIETYKSSLYPNIFHHEMFSQ